jgi:hypothetical protein
MSRGHVQGLRAATSGRVQAEVVRAGHQGAEQVVARGTAASSSL